MNFEVLAMSVSLLSEGAPLSTGHWWATIARRWLLPQRDFADGTRGVG
jgi:hypothetical protein